VSNYARAKVLDHHFARLGGYKLSDNIVIIEDKLFDGITAEVLWDSPPHHKLMAEHLPSERNRRRMEEENNARKYIVDTRNMEAAGTGDGLESDNPGMVKAFLGISQIDAYYRRYCAAKKANYKEGISENRNRLVLSVITYISSLASASQNAFKAIHFITPAILITLSPIALIALAVLAIIGVTLEGIDQTRKLFKQVDFYNSPICNRKIP
jgi:hypothetical protein